jgi:multicomponent Na+:H+ antiporter subunit D
MIDAIPPGLLLVLAGLILPLLRGQARALVLLGAPLIVLGYVWTMPAGEHGFAFLGLELMPVRVDPLGRLFAIVFSLMTFAGGLFALNQASRVELSAALVYAGSAVGAVLAGDLVTMFVFWEMMALGSAMIVWSAATRASFGAGMRYLGVHLLGGVLLMAGIADHYVATGSIAFGAMPIHELLGPDRIGTWLILAGFLINAGAPPLSAWLPDAYPEASWSGMVFLSAYTTKTAVYVLMRGFPGFEPLVFIGLFMVFYGIIYALLENDMRRILAYSIVNQVGFMVTGIGIGTAMALNGAAAHAFTHIIYKALLLMSAGSVLYMTGHRKCTDLGGLFRTMPLTCICGIIGALAISSFPLTSGFISKSMISQSALDEHLALVWFLLAAASAGVFLHAGIKFPWFVFFQRDSGLRPPDPPLNMRLAMILFAAFCIGLGIWPEPLYDLLPAPVEYVPYTAYHVVEMLQLLLFSGLAFFVLLPLMRRTLTISLDVDWLYRRLGPILAGACMAAFDRTRMALASRARRQMDRAAGFVQHHHGPEGYFARTWPTGSMVALVALVLAASLAFYLA